MEGVADDRGQDLRPKKMSDGLGQHMHLPITPAADKADIAKPMSAPGSPCHWRVYRQVRQCRLVFCTKMSRF